MKTTARNLTLALTLLPLLAGCAAGPDFTPPSAPNASSYGSKGMPTQTAIATTSHGGMQRFIAGGDVPAAWWTLYGSAELNHLINRAIKANPSIEAARASLVAAQENTKAGYGSFFPSIDGSANFARNKNFGNQNNGSNPYTLYSTSVTASYSPDVFGSNRRSVEGLDAMEEASRFELEAAYLSLTSNVVVVAITEASLREQIKATKDIISAQNQQLNLMKTQLDTGAIAMPAYLAQKAIVEQSKTSLPPLMNALAQSRTYLSILLGQLPNKDVGTAFTLSSFKLPTKVPVSLPSKLVEQRPDIRQARANLQKASADIGVAQAAMLPQFPLSASYGVSAARLADMFSPSTAIWGLGAGLAQPLFHGGSLLHQKRAAEAVFDAQAAAYRSTVLNGFKEVADALSTLEHDALTLKAHAAAEKAANESLKLTQKQHNAGAVSYVELLQAQASYQKSKLGLITAKANRLIDTAALLQALGGGWWNRDRQTNETL